MTRVTTLAEIERTLVAVLKAMLPAWPVLNERGPGPRPSTAYLTFLIAMQQGTSWPRDRHEVVEGATENDPDVMTAVLEDPVALTVQITAHGVGSQAALARVRLLLRSEKRYADLFQIVGLGGCGDVQSASTAFGGTIQERATMQVIVHAILSESEVVDWFEKQPLELYTAPPPADGGQDEPQVELTVP